MNNISKVISILRKQYPESWAVQSEPYETLISCLLSLRTKDETTEPAAERLFAKAGTPEKMLKLSEKQIQKLIYPVGFYKVKSKRIKEISRKPINFPLRERSRKPEK